MDFRSVLLILITLLNLGLGLLIYTKNRKSLTNVYFALFTLALSFWSLSLAIFLITDNVSVAFWSMRASYLVAGLIGVSFWYFSLAFPENKRGNKYSNIFTLLILFLFAVLLIADKSFLVESVNISGSITESANLNVWHHILFAIFFTAFFFGGNYIILQKYRIATGILRSQLFYIFFSVFTAGFFGALFNLIFPSPFINNYKYIWSGPIFTAIIVVCIAYAIARYRLMDIKVIIKRSTIFTLLVIIITAIYSSLIILFSNTFGNVFGKYSQLFTSFIVSALIVIGFQPLKKIVQRATRRFLFKDEYDLQDVLSELSQKLSSSLDLSTLFESVGEMVERTLHPAKTAISLLDDKNESYQVLEPEGFNVTEVAQLNFSQTDLLVLYLKQNKQIIVLQELKRRLDSGDIVVAQIKNIERLIARLDKTGGEIFLPLFSKDNLIGIFILGEKKSGDIYSTEDIRLLEIGGAQAAVAIENARLYETAKNFNVILQKEVDRATKELRDANVRLTKLDEAKSEFISIASHQLRTPLTVIKGYISMMIEGDFGTLTDREIDSLRKVYESNERLINLVEDLLNISRIESGRLQFNWQSSDLSEMAKSVVEELSGKAKERGLYLEINLPAKPLPKFVMDVEKLRQVLMNLVDNSIKYTKRGGIRVTVEEKNKQAIVKVVDTGMGVDPEDRSKLFQKFSRGKGMARVHTEGTGLGLYVAREMVEVHKGKIWAESEGKDRGSAFIFSIPMTQSRHVAASKVKPQPAAAKKN